MIKKLSLIFGSKTKAEEMVYLLSKAKQVVRQGFYLEELPRIEKFCRENNIHFVKSRFKVLLADENAYSNKGIRIPEHDKREGMYFCYLSKDEKKAWLASYYELMSNDNDLGLLLGYPKCCVDFFCKRFSPNNPNLQLNSTTMFTNLSKREKDAVLISHFPCNSECEESVQLGRKHLAIIKEADYERYKELIQNLKRN
jgi:hypothetical protein